MSLVALRGAPQPHADAYGVIDSAPNGGKHLIICLKNDGSLDESPVSVGDITTWQVHEVTFDEGDIFGTFHVSGHPGVIGLWLNTYTVGDIIASYNPDDLPDDDTSGLAGIDPFTYTVPDLAPADNGFMYVRGFVWPPGKGKLSYP